MKSLIKTFELGDIETALPEEITEIPINGLWYKRSRMPVENGRAIFKLNLNRSEKPKKDG